MLAARKQNSPSHKQASPPLALLMLLAKAFQTDSRPRVEGKTISDAGYNVAVISSADSFCQSSLI